MKKTIYLFLFFLPLYAIGQGFQKEKTANEYRKLLKIEDANQPIIKVGLHHFLTFTNNEVYKFNVVESESLIINSDKLSEKEAFICYSMLDSLKTINPSFLNIIKDETGHEMIIEDGGTFKLDLVINDQITEYTTYSPHDYIEMKFPHYQERVKFLSVIKEFNAVFFDKEYEKLKKADTIYLMYDKSKELNNLKVKATPHKNLLVYSFMFSDSKELNFQAYKKDYRKANKKSIHENNASVKINLDIINKYRYDYIVNLFNRKKVFYIIDPKDSKGKNVVLKRVNFINTN